MNWSSQKKKKSASSDILCCFMWVLNSDHMQWISVDLILSIKNLYKKRLFAENSPVFSKLASNIYSSVLIYWRETNELKTYKPFSLGAFLWNHKYLQQNKK